MHSTVKGRSRFTGEVTFEFDQEEQGGVVSGENLEGGNGMNKGLDSPSLSLPAPQSCICEMGITTLLGGKH